MWTTQLPTAVLTGVANTAAGVANTLTGAANTLTGTANTAPRSVRRRPG